MKVNHKEINRVIKDITALDDFKCDQFYILIQKLLDLNCDIDLIYDDTKTGTFHINTSDDTTYLIHFIEGSLDWYDNL
jgi:hypothetical protein